MLPDMTERIDDPGPSITDKAQKSPSDDAAEAKPEAGAAPVLQQDATGAEIGSKATAKPPPVRTLVALYTVKGANVTKLLGELAKGSSWRFDDEDVRGALELAADRDPRLILTRKLVHESIDAREGRFASTAAGFAEAVLAKDLEGLRGWPLNNDTDALDALTALAQHAGPLLGDPKEQRRAFNALIIGVDLLSYRRGLAFEDAAPILREAIGRPLRLGGQRSNPRRHRVASLTAPRNELERVRDLLDLLQPWEDEVRAAEAALGEAAADADDAHRAASEAEDQAKRVGAELADLRAVIEQMRQETEQSRDLVKDVRIHASADATELRTRAVAFLNTRLRDLLATAKEASEVDPPRSGAAVRLLEQAIQELQKEVEWLRSSV